MRKIHFKLKCVAGYILALILCILFYLICDAMVGRVMLFVLIAAPASSCLVAFISSRFIKITCVYPDDVMQKKDLCQLKINISCKAFAVPFVMVELSGSPSIRCLKKDVMVSVIPGQMREIMPEFCAEFCGPGEIGIKSVKVMDFFMIMSIDIPVMYPNKKIKVIPEMTESGLNNEIMKQIMGGNGHTYDGEETRQSRNVGFGGFPGYDYKEYEPGDPIKRINWKKSAAMGKLFVRTDDEIMGKNIILAIDPMLMLRDAEIDKINQLMTFDFYEKEQIIPALRQDMYENALALMQFLLYRDYQVEFFYEDNKVCDRIVIGEEKDLEKVKSFLSGYELSSHTAGRELFNRINSQKQKTIIFLTAVEGKNNCEDMRSISEDVIVSPVVAKDELS